MKTLEPVSSEYKVPSPKDRDNEFEVQAWLYIALKSAGFDVRGEVKWKDKETRQTCRFDLVLYKDGKAQEIIEVKWGEMNHINGVEATRQGIRYRKFGVPVTFIYGIDDADAFIKSRLGRG